MAARKLSAKQKDIVLQMLAERETHAEIAARVGCVRASVAYYAGEYKEDIQKRRAAHDAATIELGLRASAIRVARLEKLAIAHEIDLGLRSAVVETSDAFDLAVSEARDGQEPTLNNAPEIGLYYTDTKLAANGDRVTQKAYKTPQVSQYRGILDDIAKERGERKIKTESEVKVTLDITGAKDKLITRIADYVAYRSTTGRTQQPE